MGVARDDAVQITGGAGSTEAHYDDMLSSAWLLDTGGDSARSLSADLVRVIADLPAMGTLMSPGSVAAISVRTIALTLGPHGLTVLGADLEVMARGVRLSVHFYQTRDTTVAGTLTALHFVIAVPHVVGALAGAAADATAQTSLDYAAAVLKDPGNPTVDPLKSYAKHFQTSLSGRVHDDPSLTDDAIRSARIVAAVTFSKNTTFDRQLAGILGIATKYGYLLDTEKLTVTAAGSKTSRGPRTEGTIGALVHDEADTERAGNPSRSQVRVHRRIDALGQGHWVVDVPGTQEWGMKLPTNPSDATANLRSLAGTPSSLYPAINSALAAAMKKEGIPPGKEPVMLVGHSQGGLVAARLAANAQFRTRYNVTHVITIAAPESRIKIPKSVQALSIEHQADPIPRLGAVGTTDASNRTRALIDPSDEMRPGDEGLTSQHSSRLYATSADRHLGRDKDDLVLRRWYAGTEGFMNGTDKRYDYNLSRP